MNKALVVFIGVFFQVCLTQLLAASTIDLERAKGKDQVALFIENKGQVVDANQKPVDEIIAYIRFNGMDMYVGEKGLSYVFYSAPKKNSENQLEGSRVDLLWLGSLKPKEVIKLKQTSRVRNFFRKNNSISNVNAFEELILKEIYPKIDLHLYFHAGKVKYDFLIHPGADVSQINMKVDGASAFKLLETGDFFFSTPYGQALEKAPVSYQNDTQIESKYHLRDSILSFEIADYNSSEMLRIDPVREWATLYAEDSDNFAEGGVHTDMMGNIYFHGTTNSFMFPTTTGVFQLSNAGGFTDAFVAKFDANGNPLWAS